MKDDVKKLIEALELIGKAKVVINTIENRMHTKQINQADDELVNIAFRLSDCISTEYRNKHFFIDDDDFNTNQ